ncbi:MAG: Uncharacterized protein YtoI [Firmicutes bacterium]|nr:Uncharacterized protein YtoI [Bacillota bacterium]MDI6704850.1 DRTGG domain-containing protein [Bacillota bacterium]
MTKHQQIIEYIKSLKTGTRISVRRIAEAMNVSEGTAYRAIKEAETSQLVNTISRVGTVRIQSNGDKDIEKLTFSEVLNIVDGNILAGREGLHKHLNNFIIGAMTPDVVTKYLEDNNLLIVGNREELLSLALEKNCAVLITGGFDCSEKVKEEADRRELPIMNCSYDTFTVATLINKAIYNRMAKKDIILVGDIITESPYCLKTSDRVLDWKRLVRETAHTRFPVIDGDGRVAGIVTPKDITGKDDDVYIEKVMTPDPITVNPKTSVAYTAHIMIWEGIELIPVVEGKELTGVVSRQDVIKALQYRRHQPQIGKTLEETLLENFEVADNKDGITMHGRVEPFMLDNIGTGSWGTLVMLISLAVSMAVKKKKNLESVIDSFTVYSIRPVQLGDMLCVTVNITELGRNACNLDVAIISNGCAVMRAMLSASYIKK